MLYVVALTRCGFCRRSIGSFKLSQAYLNAMEERGVFDGLRIWLLSRQYSYRQLFWITGILAFLLSTVISGMAVGLILGTIAAAVGKYKKEFVALACVNIIVATNAGGSISPLLSHTTCAGCP